MRKALFLAVLLILSMGMMNSLFAQAIVTIGEGTIANTTTGFPTPYGTYFKNNRQQYLILATELENAGGGAGNINSIAFNVLSPNTCLPLPGFTIRMKQTSQTALINTYEVGEYTTVFSSPEYLPSVGWNTHIFSTPFNWNGASNILIDIVTTMIDSPYTQNASVFYTPTSFQSSLRFQSDAIDASTSLTGSLSPQRANIRLNMPAFVVTTPPNPAVLVSPTNAALLVNPNATLNWQSGGGFPTGYRLSFGTNNPPTNLVDNLDIGLVNTYSPPENLSTATTYYWRIAPYNAIGSALNSAVWSFTTYGDPTVTALPYNQNWDLVIPPVLPFDWTAIVQSAVTTSYVKTVTALPHSSPNCVAIYNGADAEANVILVGPQIAPTINMNRIRVKFWGKGNAAYHVLVGVMSDPSDPATFVSVQDINTTPNWNEYTVRLTGYSGTGRHIAIKHACTTTSQTIYLDDVVFELIAANDLAALSIEGTTTAVLNNPTVYTVNIFNNGSINRSTYNVKLYNAAGNELANAAGIAVAAGEQVAVPITWTPTAEGTTTIYGKVLLFGDADATNNQTSTLDILVIPEGNCDITIGNGSINASMPINMSYMSSMYQTLYYPDEIMVQGYIHSVKLYNNFISTNIGEKPIKIWMGTTTQSDLSAGWIPANEMSLVFDGTMNFPSGQNTITFPLTTLFPYTGGNLVVMWNRPLDTMFYNSWDCFKCQVVGTNRAREIHGDTAEYDPNNMTGGYLMGTFPQTTLLMSPMTSDPIFSLSQDSKDFGTAVINTTHSQSFTIMNTGGGSLTINSVTISGSPMFTLQNIATLPVSLSIGQTMVFSASYNPTAVGAHTATIIIGDNRTTHTIALSGNCIDTTINALPYAQNFDAVQAPALPVDWSCIYQATVTTGYVKTVTSTPQSVPNCVAMYNSSDFATIAMLIAPPLHASIAMNTVRVKFYGRGNANYAVKVGVMTNPADHATFVEIQTLALTSSWVQYSVLLSTYTGIGKYIAFKHANNDAEQVIRIDSVLLELMSVNDLAALSIVGNYTPSMNRANVYTVNVLNNGTASQSDYSVKLYNAAGTELATAAGTTIATGARAAIPISWIPTAEGSVTIYGRVLLAGDVDATDDQTPSLNIMVMPEGNCYQTIGDGLAYALMPINMFYKSSMNQTLYYPDEIGMIGSILSVSIYNHFSTTTLVDKPTKIWVGTTTQTDLSAGWIPSSQMTLVFDGTMTYPGGENTITFPLSTIFPYTGGNLVVMWNRPLDTAYFSSSDYFKCQIVGTNRAREIYNDSMEYDPNNMAGGTLTGTFPKTSLIMTPFSGPPALMVMPISKNYGTAIINTINDQNFSVVNTGGGSLIINSVSISGSPMFSLQDVATLPVILNAGELMVFTCRYSPTAAGTHNATITITDNLARSYEINMKPNASRENRDSKSRVAQTVALSGTCINTTIYTLPYAQNFDAVTVPALPIDWSRIYQANVTTGYVKTVIISMQENCAEMYNSTDLATVAMLIAPPLHASIAMNTVRVKFYGAGSNCAVKVGVMTNPTDPATFVVVQTITLSSSWAQYSVPLSSYNGTGRFVAFKHANNATYQAVAIDNVDLESMAVNDLAAFSVVGNITPSVNSAAVYTVNVFNNGTATQNDYSVKLYNAEGTELATAAGTTVAAGASVGIPLTWTPSAEGTVVIYGKVILASDVNADNDQTPNLNIIVSQEGIVNVTIGNGSTNARMPINMYYKSSMYQTLYYPEEIGMLGVIIELNIYNSFVNTNLVDMPTKIWMGTTTQADLSGGWIPANQMTLVFDGTMTYPVGENTIIFPLLAPFPY
ncbi:MAG: choice-of-anchor D domain-containing protein, partial [Candidatus Cloacimonetes bacterium]|nr:choice-of-anchor D domain-containing protein [Candidatus Cloacimonadota bacterium]